MESPIHRPSIEYSLTEHCNLSCYACDHASPLLPTAFTDLSVFAEDLAALRGILRVKRLYLIGGEPLLHPQLLEFISAGVASGIADNVYIVTNGTLLHTASDSVWQMMAGIDITLYPGVRVRMPVSEMVTKALRHNVRLTIRRSTRFRRTLLNRTVQDARVAESTFRTCRIAHVWKCHAVYRGRYYKCSIAPLTAKRLQLVDPTARPELDEDGVSLHGDPAVVHAALESYLQDTRPLPSCYYCLGTAGELVTHRQVGGLGRAQWLRE